MEGSEEHSIPEPQTDHENHQPQQQPDQQGLGFQSSPTSLPPRDSNPYPNVDPLPIDDELIQILSQELESLALKESINEEAQNLACEQATDEELAWKHAIGEEIHHLAVEEAVNEALLNHSLNPAFDEERASKQAISEELQHQASRRVIDTVRNHASKKNEAHEREMDREEGVKDESKNEPQSPDFEVNEKGLDEGEDVKDEKEEEDGDGKDEVKDEGGTDDDNDSRSEYEQVEGDNENENMGGESGTVAVSKDGTYRRYNYPLRPDAEDCAYYMRTGTCKFGSNCKFNHPSRRKNQAAKEKVKQKEENPERPGQTECKYYQMSGGCKFGKACRYNHSRGKTSAAPILELNFLGLPIRPGEKECPYYMRNGSCKYGSNCRFNHPDPTAVGGGDPPTYGNGGSVSLQGTSQSTRPSWSSPRTLNETAPFVAVMFPPTQGVPSPNPEWNGYQAPVYPTSERSLPTPPAFSMNNAAIETNFYTHHQQQMLVEEFPERPGQPECSFFLKTGDCKYKSGCKFHHPKNRIHKTAACVLSDKGLPLRPDQNVCTHYSRYGICKFGPACRYDHPVNYGNLDASAGYGLDQPPASFGYSSTANGARMAGSANGNL